jgi:hypothetical protein
MARLRIVATLLCLAGCDEVPVVAHPTPAHFFVACLDAPDDPAWPELHGSFKDVELGSPDRAECQKAKQVAAEVAADCVDRRGCELPTFVNGTKIPVDGSKADRVLVLTGLRLGTHVETSRVTHGSGNPRRPQTNTTTSTEVVTDPGRSGLIFVFDAVAGQVVGATNVDAATPQDLARTFEKLMR